MTRVEDLLADQLCFGHPPCNRARSGRPDLQLFEVARDLEGYVKRGQLVEVPITCSLAEIIEAEHYYWHANPPYLKLLESDFMGRFETIEFRTVPENTLYVLTFTKGDRTPLSGHFTKGRRDP